MTWVIGALVLALLMPTLAGIAAEAIPALVSLLALLAVVRLAWPPGRRR